MNEGTFLVCTQLFSICYYVEAIVQRKAQNLSYICKFCKENKKVNYIESQRL